MAPAKVTQAHDAKSVCALFGLPEIRQLMADLDELRWTGRPGFGPAMMVGAALVKAAYVRFLIGDPDSEVTRQREVIEATPLTVSTRIAVTLEQLERLCDVDAIEAVQ